MKRDLAGKKLCLRCGHLYIKTDDAGKRICVCENPVLVPATLVYQDGINRLRQKPEYQKLLS